MKICAECKWYKPAEDVKRLFFLINRTTPKCLHKECKDHITGEQLHVGIAREHLCTQEANFWEAK